MWRANRAILLIITLSMIISLLSIPVFSEQSNKAIKTNESAEAVIISDEPTEKSATIENYSEFLSSLTELEAYADDYSREHDGEDVIALVINFVRTGVEKYNSGTWNTFCGVENTAFSSFVSEQDSRNGTNASSLKNLGEFTLPNGDEVEFSHMFGCMDMAYHTGNQATADLGSWAGDICDLVQLSQNYGVSGSVEEMADQIRNDNDNLFLYDNPHEHSFGKKDFYGDLDAFYILNCLGGGKTISDIMRSYYTDYLDDCFRAAYFLENRLNGVNTKSSIRTAVFEIYSENEGIHTLEGTYLTNGVNPDIRKACCFAFADYLYLTAYDRLNNPYFTIFSSEKTLLAPGVTQEKKMAMSADNKQMAYYIATADISRNDVSVYANYGDNDGSEWKMARVSDQVAAAQAKHSNPEDLEHYIPNYNAVASVNADFYNMSNGAVSGTLIMEGVEYHGITSSNFFGILKDGTPVIGGKNEWDACHDQLQEAVGASIWLVKNGKIAVTSTTNYYNDRASRTAVGITYDGRVVLMVLDGRQEPYSCGGSAIEIAQIMLDAGCVSAVNLDGGGSTTYVAKQEGSDECSVVNRPSDGYERSVSSSLLVVSTAKPSNIFDHAVLSADYDYLTVGSSIAVRATGVTATGGSISLPEGSSMQVSDSNVGTLSNNIFTAKKLGDVQVEMVSSVGEVIGSKTLHVVEPTDLKFSRESINAVYGEPEELPLEATYDGKPVLINPNDITFGYLKVTLQSIGDVEGGAVNTTRTQLVFDYPQAGEISGFKFTGNESGGLRTLTIGAVLSSRLEEFQNTISSTYSATYQDSIENGFTDEQAKLIAEEASVNAALNTAARIDAYLYYSDEANFDFAQETGNDGLLHWKREVSNSFYQREINMYYRQNPSDPMTTSYTFAVDMSKMPIPEKLTGLLYMLPGGDQDGRTAWSFLLQLAERISPLTTVTVSIQVPDGFEVDYSNLKMVNEYFDLTSTKLQNNTLTITGNFKLQTEPINPTTANPLCVLSGLKLTPTESSAWDEVEPDQLEVKLTGSLNYDIYAHFHVLKSLAAQEEYQENYGLYPYDNSDKIPLDYGAHFASDEENPIEFIDQYRLNRLSKDGWVYEQGAWYFYKNGSILTGPQNLPSYEDGEEGKYWYDLGENGKCNGKLTGMFELDGDHYYAGLGELKTGWREIPSEQGENLYYYFNPKNYKAVDGVQIIDKHTYTFEDHILVKGDWTETNTGKRYYWAGRPLARKWREIDGKRYYFGYHGDAMVGFCMVERANGNQGADFYLFDNDGALIIQPGLFKLTDELPYIHKDFQAGDTVFFDETGKAVFAGLVMDGDNYYYINANLKAARGGQYWVTKTNDLVKSGLQRTFDVDGKMVVREGVQRLDNGYLVYYINDDIQSDLGLVKLEDGRMIYVNKDMTLHANGKHSITKTNGILPAGQYLFDKEGYLQLSGLLTEENGSICYYENGTKSYAGLVQDMDGNYYYINSSLTAVRGVTYYVTKTNGLLNKGYYTFDDDGKMILKNGFVEENGEFYYYEQGSKVDKGMVEHDGAYYYFPSSLKAVKNEWHHVFADKANGLVTAGYYFFDESGKMHNNGIREENGNLYYYENGVKTYAGLIEIDGAYYYITSGCTAVRDKDYYVTRNNGLMPSKTYLFGADGKMIMKNGIYREKLGDGEYYLFYYVDNVRQMNTGLTKMDDGRYIYVRSGADLAIGDYYVYNNNDLLPRGTYHFGEDGIMIFE